MGLITRTILGQLNVDRPNMVNLRARARKRRGHGPDTHTLLQIRFGFVNYTNQATGMVAEVGR